MTTEYEAVTESDWKDLATTEITHLTDEETDYLPRAWDEWIARVRRDAAREALAGLEAEVRAKSSEYRQRYLDGITLWVDELATWTARYRDTHYPEETP